MIDMSQISFKRDEKELLKKQKELTNPNLDASRLNFINLISYELGSALHMIKGYTEIVEKKNVNLTPEERARCFELINKNILRLERFVKIMAEFDNIERGTFQLKLDKIDIHDLLETVLQQYKLQLGDQFQYLNTTKSDGKLIGAIDSERLSHALDHVIRNAIEHTLKAQRRIEVICKESKDHKNINISISDNGAGITSENLGKVQDAFVSLPTKYSVGGIGVGLFLSTVIIEYHGGTLTVESEGLGKGTTVKIEFPIKTT
jgi:signal transduction histidine kinase